MVAMVTKKKHYVFLIKFMCDELKNLLVLEQFLKNDLKFEILFH